MSQDPLTQSTPDMDIDLTESSTDKVSKAETAAVVDKLPAPLDGLPMAKPQLLIYLDGKAGTGQSCLIHILSAKLEQLAEEERPPQKIKIPPSAPTGVAVYNISGRKPHSLLHIPINVSMGPYKLVSWPT